MTHEEKLQQIRVNEWARLPDAVINDGVATMLSTTERKMLHWLAKEWPGSGCIVDGGAFLGGSTVCLAAGERTVHSYDMFVAPNEFSSLTLIGGGRRPGDDVFDLFEKNTAGITGIVAHRGDLLEQLAPDGPIDILFIDVAKTWKLNGYLVANFFPRLVPGESLVIQQDHNDHSCPWVNLTMEYYADSFDFLTDDGGSRIYLYKAPLADMPPPLRDLPTSEKLALMAAAARRSKHPNSRYISLVSASWFLFDDYGLEVATNYLKLLDVMQPWEGDSYAELVSDGMRAVGDPGTLSRWHEDYFKPSPAQNSGVSPA